MRYKESYKLIGTYIDLVPEKKRLWMYRDAIHHYFNEQIEIEKDRANIARITDKIVQIAEDRCLLWMTSDEYVSDSLMTVECLYSAQKLPFFFFTKLVRHSLMEK